MSATSSATLRFIWVCAAFLGVLSLSGCKDVEAASKTSTEALLQGLLRPQEDRAIEEKQKTLIEGIRCSFARLEKGHAILVRRSTHGCTGGETHDLEFTGGATPSVTVTQIRYHFKEGASKPDEIPNPIGTLFLSGSDIIALDEWLRWQRNWSSFRFTSNGSVAFFISTSGENVSVTETAASKIIGRESFRRSLGGDKEKEPVFTILTLLNRLPGRRH